MAGETVTKRARVEIDVDVKGESKADGAARSVKGIEDQLGSLGESLVRAANVFDKAAAQMARDAKKVDDALEKASKKSFFSNVSDQLGELGRNMANIEAGFNLFTGAIRSTADAFDEALTRGNQFNLQQQALKFSIDAARVATRGLSSDMDLMLAANRAAVFGVAQTSEEFARLASAATIAGQKMGLEAGKALNDLITGLARASGPILDNIGIKIKAGEASRAHAEKLGIEVSALTDVQKAAGFAAAAADQLKAITEGSTVAVIGAGGAWAQLKINIGNASDEAKAFISGIEGDGARLKVYADGVKLVTDSFKALTGSMDSTGKEADQLLVSLSRLIPGLDRALGLLADVRRFQGIEAKAGGFADRASKRATDEAGDRTIDTLTGLGLLPDTGKIGGVSTELGVTGSRGRQGRVKFKRRRPIGVDVSQFGAAQGARDLGGLTNQEKTEALVREREAVTAADAAWNQYNQTTEKAFQTSLKLAEQQTEFSETLNQLGSGVLNNLAGGFLDIADAAIQGSEGVGQLALALLKGVTLGLAKQLFALGVTYEIKGAAALASLIESGLAPGYFSAAKLAFAGAGTVGAIGLGISGIQASSSGGSGGGGGSRSSRGGGGGRGSSFRPSLGGSRDQGQGVITNIVEVHLDRATALDAMTMNKTIKRATER